MAINSTVSKITMDAYDFGIQLPFIFSEFPFEEGDKLLFELKKNEYSSPIIEKTFDNDYENMDIFVFSLDFTQKESAKIPPGNYLYYIKLIRNDEVKDTFLSDEFIIKNK